MSAHERERLSAYLDGELTAAERAEVEAHLAACAACAALLATMGEVDDVARELPVEAPSGYFDSFPGRVRARIATEGAPPARPARPRAHRRLPAWTWAAAAALLLAVITPMTIPNLMRARIPASDAPVAQAPAAQTRPQAAETLPERTLAPAGDDESDAAPPQRREAGRGRLDRDYRVGEAEPFAPPPPPAAAAAPRPGLGARAGKRDVPAVSAPPIAENRPLELAKDAPTFAVDPAEGEALEEATVAGVAGRERAMADTKAARAAPEPGPVGVASAPMARTEVSPAPAGPVTTLEAESRAELAAVEKKAQLSEDSLAFAALTRGIPEDASAWRERREAWRAFIAEHPQSPRLDEAWVRMIEAGLEAWAAGGDPGDYTRARADAAAYLQKGRIRRAIEEAERR
jgi:negative regulator of sigma E activity